MTKEEWENFWIKFDAQADNIDDKFQKEMVKKHGKGHYYIDPDEHWVRQQKIIRKLVEAVFKEKNMPDCQNCEYHRKRAQHWRDEAYKQAGHPLPLYTRGQA